MRVRESTTVLSVVLGLVACSPGAPTGGPADAAGPCPDVSGVDQDSDGISDLVEGDLDTDEDGTLDRLDEDSDDDGLVDRLEAMGPNCRPRDTDQDGRPDYRDVDSDNDGLFDADEKTAGSDPLRSDTDDDGVPDVVEVKGSKTDPLDPTSAIDLSRNFFVVLPYQAEAIAEELRFSTDIAKADIFFLVDSTASMRGERRALIEGLVDTIIPGIEAVVPDVQFGVGGLADYPTGTYGDPNDAPFYMLHRIAPPLEDRGRWSVEADSETCPTGEPGSIDGAANGRPDLLEAVEGIRCLSGGDEREAFVPALFASATGRGLSWPNGTMSAQSCPPHLGPGGALVGYPCFRPGALPVIILFGDAPFHNASTPTYSFSAPSYAQTVNALSRIGARVVGMFSGDEEAVGDYRRVARDTGAVDADGAPLVFTVDQSGDGLDQKVVEAVDALVVGTRQDVRSGLRNGDSNPDRFDATRFIRSIAPVEGYVDGEVGGYVSKGTEGFTGVDPDAEVVFEVTFRNTVRPVEAVEVHRAHIIVVGNQVAELDVRDVYILIPTSREPILI